MLDLICLTASWA